MSDLTDGAGEMEDPALLPQKVTISKDLFDSMVIAVKSSSTVGGGWWSDPRVFKLINRIRSETGLRIE